MLVNCQLGGRGDEGHLGLLWSLWPRFQQYFLRYDDLEVADLILKGLNGAIASKWVTYDFARLMEGVTEIKCSEVGDNVIAHRQG